MANTISVSLVEVSLSTVIALNDFFTAFDSIACNTSAVIGASVKTKDSIVAMSGAIMPAPLAMPVMVTSTPPSFTVRLNTFGKVSVVMIARAASSVRAEPASATTLSSTAVNFAGGSGSPITPVEARKTSFFLHPAALAAAAAVSETVSRPFLPVKALALPELTTRARAVPLLKALRHQSTGAEGHFEVVKTPATVVPLSNSATRRSVRPLYLIPACVTATRTPSIGSGSAKDFGARGETVALILVLAPQEHVFVKTGRTSARPDVFQVLFGGFLAFRRLVALANDIGGFPQARDVVAPGGLNEIAHNFRPHLFQLRR